MRIVYSPVFLEHVVPPGFPESPDRVIRILKHLQENEELELIEPEPISESGLLNVHSQGLIDEVKRLSAGGVAFGDNPFCRGTFKAALASAAAALTAARSECFALNRPPGHHASRDAFAGFCYFNNVCFAVQSLLDEGRAKRVLIVDFDVHHGNGTQAIFAGREDVYYVSTHESPFYPGTGLTDGPNYSNNPLPAGTTCAELIGTLRASVERAVNSFEPDYLAVSAGFDCSASDPISSLAVTSDGFSEIGVFLESLGLPSFGVLEGGYGSTLAEDALAFLEGFLK